VGSPHWLAEAEQVALAIFEPGSSFANAFARIVPLDVGDAVHGLEAGQVVFLKKHAALSQRRYNGFYVGNLPSHLSVIARSRSRGLEHGKVAAAAAVTKASRPLLKGLQPELLGVKFPCPLEVFSGKPRKNLGLC